jgi:hypothetical protein
MAEPPEVAQQQNPQAPFVPARGMKSLEAFRAETYNEFLPGVFISNGVLAMDASVLSAHKVRFVFQTCQNGEVAANFPSLEPCSDLARWYTDRGITWRSRPMEDHPSPQCDIQAFLHTVVAEVCEDTKEAKRAGGTVLIHCVSGMNRSATLALALLMRVHHCAYSPALRWLTQQRSLVHPCSHYQLQLLKWEDILAAESPLRKPSFSGSACVLS